MLGQILDLLTKQDSERRMIVIFAVKIIFTLTLTAVLVLKKIPGIYPSSIADISSGLDYINSGKIIVTFVAFYVVWVLSYTLPRILLNLIASWISRKLTPLINAMAVNPTTIIEQVNHDASLMKIFRWWEFVGITEQIDGELKPGSEFYYFFDYLIDIENRKKIITRGQYSDIIAIVIQFIFINNAIDLAFLSGWLCFFTVLIIVLTITINLGEFVIAHIIDRKSKNLLTMMEKIDPQYHKIDSVKDDLET